MSPLRTIKAGLIAVAAAALFAGPLAQSASAATFFRTFNDANANTSLAISSSRNNAPLVFVPEFEGTFVCASCGIAGIPDQQVWSEERLVPGNRATFLVNRATGKCADIELDAQAPDANAVGAQVVLAPCDGTSSQRWKNLFAAGGNQNTFQNELTGLFLTNHAADGVILANSAGRLPAQEKRLNVQTFGSTRADVD
jgi:hypothetical protein